ncbi:MAG: hypothetical protein ACOCZU_00545 [Planctomycetota bacterium]
MSSRRIPHILTAPLAVLLIAAATLVGCTSAEQRAREDKDRRDIRRLLRGVRGAILSGNRDAWLASLHGSPMEKRFAAELFNLWQTSFRFRDAFIGAYGPQAWRDLQDHRPTRVSVPPTPPGYWEEIAIRLKGDRARCETRYQIHMWWVDRLPQGWRIRAGDLLNQRSANLTPELITDHILSARSTRYVTHTMMKELLDNPPPPHEQFIQAWKEARKRAVLQRRELGAFDANVPVGSPAPTSQPSDPSER